MGREEKGTVFSPVRVRVYIFLLYFQDLASILHKASRESGSIDPNKVTEILGVTQEEVTVPETMSVRASGPGPPLTAANQSQSDIPGMIIRNVQDPRRTHCL